MNGTFGVARISATSTSRWASSLQWMNETFGVARTPVTLLTSQWVNGTFGVARRPHCESLRAEFGNGEVENSRYRGGEVCPW